jgi:hypothetical protein
MTLVNRQARVFRLSWKWKERSAVKITERTREALHRRREGRHLEAAFAWNRSRSPSSVMSWPVATVFYRWQKEFFENGAAAFQSQERPHRQVDEKQKRIEFLEKKVQTKDEVLAELMAEHVALKKTLGEL